MHDATLGAIVAAVPSTLSALGALIYGVRNHRQIRSPNGLSTGTLVYKVVQEVAEIRAAQERHEADTTLHAHEAAIVATQAAATAAKAAVKVAELQHLPRPKRSTDP